MEYTILSLKKKGDTLKVEIECVHGHKRMGLSYPLHFTTKGVEKLDLDGVPTWRQEVMMHMDNSFGHKEQDIKMPGVVGKTFSKTNFLKQGRG